MPHALRTTAADSGPIVLTVSELNRAVREVLEQTFGLLWVEGEVSNLARPRSGHLYFSLADGAAQVRCALFRNKARLARTPLDNGAQVRVRARVGLYTARGDYQLIVEHVEDAGDGALRRAFEQIKAKLDAQGLFAADRKRGLPAAPARIGVVTSATGAAIRDVLSVVSRRYPLGTVRVYPVAVQGEAAPAAIAGALARASARADCDVLLLVRGGGSLEDLQAFNDEAVARAIAACATPVVAGIGHEVDVTIADLAADVRAATPSAAAELVCPDMGARAAAVAAAGARLRARVNTRLLAARHTLDGLAARLARQHPRRRLEAPMQRLDTAELRLQRAIGTRLARQCERHSALARRLRQAAPARRIAGERARCDTLSRGLVAAQRQRLTGADARLRAALRALHSVSPLQTLERGYAIARDDNGRILRAAERVSAGQRIAVDLARGRLDCEVRAALSQVDRLGPIDR